MAIPVAINDAFPPSADMLLDRARNYVDDAMLMEIARADYGYTADEVFRQLRPIRDEGIIPSPLIGPVAEALQLSRFCDPDRPNLPPFEPGPSGRRGHQIRLFACAVLLRDDFRDDTSLANCLTSAGVLGDEMSEAVARFLTWQLSRVHCIDLSVLSALALLIVAIRLRYGRITDKLLGDLAEWVLAEEARGRVPIEPNPQERMPAAFSLQQGFWQPLALELAKYAATIDAPAIRESLQMCALLLDPV
jgi:hypothetical protein